MTDTAVSYDVERDYASLLEHHFRDDAEGAAAPRTNRSGARGGALLVRSDAAVESLPPMSWLADGILPLGGLAAIYGPPGSGKSFLSLDLALSLAAGAPWLGRQAVDGGTLYVAGEGLAGLSQRVVAWKMSRGLHGRPLGVGFVTDGIDLLRPGDVARVIAAAQSDAVRQPVRTIVFDTLARSMVGDENETKDMSRVVAAADSIRAATGALVLFDHHTRKDSDQERGSTVLRGAVDTLLLAEEGDDGRQLVCQKQKDAEPFPPIPFRLVAGHGSCVVASTGGDSPAGSTEPGDVPSQLTPARLKALRTLADAFTAKGATTTEWIRASALPERTYYHVRTWLVREGYVAEKGQRYTLTESGRSAIQTAKALQSPLQAPFGSPLKGDPRLQSRAATATALQGYSDGSDGYWGDLMSEVDERLGLQEDG